MLYPEMLDDVLAVHDRLTLWVGAAVAVPVAVSVVVEGWALLVNVRVALSAPATSGVNVTVNGALCPARIVTGSDRPLIVNSELFELAAVTVTFAPVALRFPVAVPLVPATTLPIAMGAGVAVSCPAVADPVPVRGMVKVGLEPFEVTVTLPLALPADSGAKVTLKVALCPAVSAAGVEIPLTVNPVPLLPTCEMVTVDPPVFVTVSDNACLLPTVTVPKLRLVGFAPTAPSATPVPDIGRDSGELGASEVIVTLPLALPAVGGENVAVNVVLCEALSARGVVMPVSPNPLPLTETCEMFTVEPVLLVSVTVWLLLVPSVTLPKLSLVGLTVSWPLVTPLPVSESAAELSEALLVMETVALKAPAALGVNTRLMGEL